MKLFQSHFLSLKWKLAFSLVFLSMGLVALYVGVAKNIFETDKIAYVFDAQQAQLQAISNDIQQKFERVLFDSRSLLLAYDDSTQRLNGPAQSYFDRQDTIMAVRLVDPSTGRTIALITKGQVGFRGVKVPTEPMVVEPLVNSQFLISARSSSGNTENPEIYTLQVLAKLPNLLPTGSHHRTILLAKNNRLLAIVGDDTNAQFFLDEFAKEQASLTGIRTLNGKRYLLSGVKMPSGLNLLLIDPESVALSAISSLYKQSIVFIAFSSFIIILLSLGLSLGLTRKLNLLAIAAGRVGRGDFSAPPTIKSHDEVGLLAKAFHKMCEEIQNLLEQTKEKGRMEAELQTARIVQESLFPSPPSFEYKDFSVHGLYVTSSECGGDWWYYFQIKNHLYVVVADATGHGTPAALITAAARSLFSKLERREEEVSLLELAQDWDRAIYSCSHQKVLMTAFLLKLNLENGIGSFVNASHEPPFRIDRSGDFESILSQPGPILGEGKHSWTEEPLQLKPGERILLFTDGIWAVEDPQGKTLGEGRFLRKAVNISKDASHDTELLRGIFRVLEDHRKGTPFPDDVTMVVIGRKSS